MGKSIPSKEQETTISWMRGDESFEVYTSDTTVMTKLDKLVAVNPHWFIKKETEEAKWYKAPVKAVSFRNLKPVNKESRIKMAERGRKLGKQNKK